RGQLVHTHRAGIGAGNSAAEFRECAARVCAAREVIRRQTPNYHQNVAIGLSGDPVPPLIGSGAAVKRNSQRLRAAAASLNASRSQLSIKCIPRDTNAKSCTAPGRSDGETYCG